MIERTLLILMVIFVATAPNASAQVKAWGDNVSGQIGDGTSGTTRPSPVTLSGLADVVSLGGGNVHSVALRSDGTLVAWGRNDSGQLGNGLFHTTGCACVSSPGPVVNLTGVESVRAGGFHNLALRTDGTVWAWGSNAAGQLGDGSTNNRSQPVQVIGLNGVVAIEAGYYHSLAVRSDGTVWAWGGNINGQVGNGTTGISVTSPTMVAGLANAIAVAGGEYHSLALRSDGTVWGWGINFDGRLGNGQSGSFVPVTSPVQASITDVTQIAAGYRHSIAVKPDGSVWGWGSNASGQVGNGSVSAQLPTPVPALITDVTDVRSQHGYHTLARKRDGSIWVWGSNGYGQFGNGAINPNPQPTPSQIVPLGSSNVIFGAGTNHSLLSVPTVPTSGGSPVVAILGEARVGFATVATPGSSTISAIDPSTTGLLPPPGYDVAWATQGYEIATTATWTTSADVCVKVPMVYDPATFANLRLLHGEGVDLLDRTTATDHARREVCGTVGSLSPFVIGRAPTAPLPSGRVPDGASAPGTPLTVARSGSDLLLGWGDSCAASDTDYEIYEGLLGDFTSHVARLCTTGGQTSVTISPAAGARYYLVVPANTTSEGSYGRDSFGQERQPAAVPCKQPMPGACP